MILPMCCFCERVRDDAGTYAGEGEWQEMKNYKVTHGLMPVDAVFAYGCCPDCLADDPRAIAFRTRRHQSSSSLRGKRENRESLRQY